MITPAHEDRDIPSRIDRHTFLIGPAYDDVNPVFVIDSRDYPDSDAVTLVRSQAADILARAHIITTVEYERVPADSARLSLPSWEQWYKQAFSGGQPDPDLPVQPQKYPATSILETTARAEQAKHRLRDEFLRIAQSTFPDTAPTVSEESDVYRHGPGRVGSVGERYRCHIGISIRQAGPNADHAIAALTKSLTEAGWQVGPPRAGAAKIAIAAEHSGFEMVATYDTRWGTMQLFGITPSYEVVATE